MTPSTQITQWNLCTECVNSDTLFHRYLIVLFRKNSLNVHQFGWSRPPITPDCVLWKLATLCRLPVSSHKKNYEKDFSHTFQLTDVVFRVGELCNVYIFYSSLQSGAVGNHGMYLKKMFSMLAMQFSSAYRCCSIFFL